MTHQASEKLHYQGQVLGLRTYPLEIYLEQLQPPMPLPFVGTHLRRSHHGEWAFEDNRLMLKKLTLYIFTHANQMRYGSPHHAVGLDYLFPDQPDGVHVAWYSGESIAYVVSICSGCTQAQQVNTKKTCFSPCRQAC